MSASSADQKVIPARRRALEDDLKRLTHHAGGEGHDHECPQTPRKRLRGLEPLLLVTRDAAKGGQPERQQEDETTDRERDR